MENYLTRIAKVQAELKAPKGQYNSFGKYNYRSCEDILEAAKPLCCKHGLVLTLSDEVVAVADRIYVKATATITDTETGSQISNTAYAREALEKKGMDDSQITGTASSYARKYALNGLFCIDDTKDADTDEYQNQQARPAKKPEPKQTAKKPEPKPEPQADPKPQMLICTACGNEVKPVKKADGTIVTADVVYNSCGALCVACYNKIKGGNN